MAQTIAALTGSIFRFGSRSKRIPPIRLSTPAARARRSPAAARFPPFHGKESRNRRRGPCRSIDKRCRPRTGPKSGSARACCWPASRPAADPPPEDPAFRAAGGPGMGQLALHDPPRLGHPPVVHRQPVAGPQGEAQQVEPAGLMDRAAAPAGLNLHERLPNSPAERGGPGVAVDAHRGGQPLDKPLRPLGAVGAKGAIDRRAALAATPPRRRTLRARPRFVGRDVGLRGRADVELQPPTSPPAQFAAPQVQRADFREPGVEIGRKSSPPRPSSASAARCGSAAAA